MKNIIRNIIFLGIILLGISAGTVRAQAADAVSVRDIDYEKLTMKIYKNGNSIVYFSTSAQTSLSDWDEVVGVEAVSEGYILVDISWASAAAETSFYLRGDVVSTAVKVTLPKQTTAFKVKFDKASSTFMFSGKEDQPYFFYRKCSDYNWKKVMFDESDPSYAEFKEQVEQLRFKGSKLILKLGQNVGCTAENPDDFGDRPSKEVAVTISKYASAPSMKVNITKLTLNTKATMEFSDDLTEWKPCTKNMNLEDITTDVFCAGATAGTAATIYFRVAQSDTKPASQIAAITIPGQRKAPTVGTTDSMDVRYSYSGKYLVLNFLSATAVKPFEYCIDKTGDFNEHTAKWKTVKSNKDIKISQKSVEDAEVYVRLKGTNSNVSKKIDLELPSDYTSFLANGFDEPLQ